MCIIAHVAVPLFWALTVMWDNRVIGECQFPEMWSGTWFQSGVRHSIHISGGMMTGKGKCVDLEGDKFVMEDKSERCFRCVVIHEKHENVLQYKETFCDSWATLPTLCSGINGDAILHSMFRLNASPVSCPFRGPLTFTYNRGHEECRSPASNVDSCTEDSRLLFRYQACPDVAGTESTAEELVCMATWREGSTRYLVGKVDHTNAKTDEERFRCYVFSKSKTVYNVAQSGDATCFGLLSPTEGSKTFKLHRARYPPSTCNFPTWVTHYQLWHSLDNQRTYKFDVRSNHTFSIEDKGSGSGAESHFRCLDEHASMDSRTVFATHVITGCANGYVCISFVRRSHHVIEVQSGSVSRSASDACDVAYFDRTTIDYTTLTTPTPESTRCPYKGQYMTPMLPSQRPSSLTTHSSHMSLSSGVAGVSSQVGCPGLLTITVGCRSLDVMEFHDHCQSEPKIEAYHCHGTWEENGTGFLITTVRGSNYKQRYCFVYTESENMVKFTSIPKSCKRDVIPGVGGSFSYNVTNNGQCELDLSLAIRITSSRWFALLLAAFVRVLR